jgi:PASTA domain
VIGLLVAAALGASAQPAPFEVLSVSSDLRVVRVAYEAGPCWRGEPQVGLAESRHAVRITVVRERVEGCSEPPSYRRVNLLLRQPLGGRRIEGGPRIEGAPRALEPRVVPRVLDLRPADARRALAVQGLRMRRLGRPTGAVAFQSPLAGRRARGRAVRLTVGRNLFRTRSLDGCLERGGIPTLPRKPKPGDGDAPDLVLWLRHADAMASVGLYVDPVRATELAPGIRRNVRRFHGVFERTRLVTFAWYAPPDATLRERARRCVLGDLGRPRS